MAAENIGKQFSPIELEVFTIFNEVQITEANHRKNAFKLKKVYEKFEFKEFLDTLKRTIHGTVLDNGDVKSTNMKVRRIVKFIGVFCGTLNVVCHANRENVDNNNDDTEDEEGEVDLVISELSAYLLETSQSAIDNTRYRSCEIINNILNNLKGKTLSGKLYESLKTYLLDRLEDIKMPIRMQAIHALYRLQDLNDEEDQIIPIFLKIMACDGSAKVRKLCVERIALNRKVLPELILRVQDVNLDIRISAMRRLSEHIKALTISQKHKILSMGLDFSQELKQIFTSTILSIWLKCYDNDILALLKGMRLGFSSRDIEKRLHFHLEILNNFFFKVSTREALLKVLPLNEQNLMPYKELNWETVSYLRFLAEHLRKNESDDFGKILPEPVVFCKYVKEYACTVLGDLGDQEAFAERQFIITQFFLVTRLFNYCDPPSRKALVEMLVFMLHKAHLTEDTLKTVVGNLELLYPNPNKRCEYICEIISEIFCPLVVEEHPEQYTNKESQLSRLQSKLNILFDDQKAAIENEDFEQESKLKHEIAGVQKEISVFSEDTPQEAERKMDVCTLSRCLDVACAGLLTLKSPTFPDSMKVFKNEVVQNSGLLVHENDLIKSKALKFYSMCSSLDKPTAVIGINLFSIPIIQYQENNEVNSQMLVVCIKAVADLLRVYSNDIITEPIQNQDESMQEENRLAFTEGVSLTKIIKGLVDLMDDENYEVRETAIIALIKLVLDERIQSAPLVSRLVLKWCTPATGVPGEEEENDFLKQLIGRFMEQLPQLSNHLELLEGVFILTITSLFNAPDDHPLANVDIDNIAKFVLSLCKISRHGPEINNNIARSLCIRIRDRPRVKINLLYSKILLMLDLSETISDAEIQTLCEQILNSMVNRTVLSNTRKFRAKLLEKHLNKRLGGRQEQEALENESAQIFNSEQTLNQTTNSLLIDQL